MYLTVQRRRVSLDAGMWISPEDIMARAKAAAQWPACRVYLEWDNGKEPIMNDEELRFAARLVHTHHCANLYHDRYIDVRPPPPPTLQGGDEEEGREETYPHIPIPFPPARPSPPNSPPNPTPVITRAGSAGSRATRPD